MTSWITNARRARRVAVLGLLAGFSLGSVSLADRLVLRDSTTVETRGPWSVEGRQVVFETPDGVLTSIRVDRVDLEASAVPPKDPAPVAVAVQAPRRAVAVLDGSNVRPYRKSSASPEARSSSAEADGTAKAGSPDAGSVSEPSSNEAFEETLQARVRVVEYQAESSSKGVSFVGYLSNESRQLAGNLRMTATLADSTGEAVASSSALIATRTLGPGERTRFKVQFDDTFVYDQVRFEVEEFAVLTSHGEGATGD